MYCSNCGSQNDKTSKFCYTCGAQLLNNNVQNNNNGNQETSLILGIICLVSSFFLNIICFIPGIISIVYAKKYKKESGKLGAGFGLSLGGMIFSAVVLLITIFFFVFIANVINDVNINNAWDYDYNTEYTNTLPKL